MNKIACAVSESLLLGRASNDMSFSKMHDVDKYLTNYDVTDMHDLVRCENASCEN